MNKKTTKEKINFYKKHVGKDTKHNKYRNLEWDKPSNTILAHLYKDGLLFIHPDIKQARSITPREAAAIQSFHNDFILSKNNGISYKMIGNAVPPKMAKIISEVLIKYINIANG